MKTLHFDIMLHDRYVFTLHYRKKTYRVDMKDVAKEIIKRRPSLKDQPYVIICD